MTGAPDDLEAPASALGRALIADDGSDAQVVAFWLGHLRVGLVLYGVATLVAAVYLLLTPDGPHRSLEWAMVAVALVATLVVVALPRQAIARSPRRLVFFVSWSVFSCGFVGLVAALDYGLRSPLAMLLLIPTTYASLAYPVRAVVGIGGVAVVTATIVAVSSGNTLAETIVFACTIGMVTLLSAWVTHARDAQQVARRRLTRRLVELARQDGLTGCLNHRAFYEQLTYELARAVRHGHAASLLVLDIDDFKAINDTHGHLVGDDVLRAIGDALRGATRHIDAVGRIGGDEFAVLVVEATQPQLLVAAGRVQAAVAAMDVPVPVAVTVGVAHIDHPGADLSAQRLVALADGDLYVRKHQIPAAPMLLGSVRPG